MRLTQCPTTHSLAALQKFQTTASNSGPHVRVRAPKPSLAGAALNRQCFLQHSEDFSILLHLYLPRPVTPLPSDCHQEPVTRGTPLGNTAGILGLASIGGGDTGLSCLRDPTHAIWLHPQEQDDLFYRVVGGCSKVRKEPAYCFFAI